MSTPLIVLLSCFLPAAILMTIGIVWKVKTTNKLDRCTVKTVGEVSGFDARGNGVYYPVVEYEVDGEVYKGKLIYRSVAQVSSPRYKGSEVTNDKFAQTLHIRRNSILSTNPMRDLFPIGSPLDVYYNPEKPKENFVQRRPKSMVPAVFIFTGVLFIALGILFFFILP